MSDRLGSSFLTGELAPETGTYQLVNDRPEELPRIDLSRVIHVNEGEPLPPHPDTGAPVRWRFVRVSKPYQFQG